MNTHKPRVWRRFPVLSAILAAILLAGIVQAGTVSIETWDEGEQSLLVDSNNTTASESLDTAASIGGERDIHLEWLSGTTGAIYAYVDYGGTSDRFSYTAGDGMMGRVTLQWDGNDNDPINLDNQGLDNVDLTDSGTNDGIWLVILFEDLKSTLRLEVYADTTALNWSYATISLPRLDPGTRMDIFVPFSDFQTGGGTGADFTDVGAIVMRLDANIQAGADVSIDFCDSTSVRDYGDLPVGTYGTSILSANHIPQGLRLGDNVDAEATYQSSTGADGDNTNGADDEDGVVTRNTPWSAGSSGGRVRFTINGCQDTVDGCYVNGWIDWNHDGDFNDTVDGASEHIVNNFQDIDGTYSPYLNTPTSFAGGQYYARFRICTTSTACDSPDDTDTNVRNGEVEDYRWIIPTAVKLTSFTATGQAGRVLVAWETASEIDNLGFNLYRRQAGTTDYAQLNSTLIPSQAPGQGQGASYTFVDQGVKAGQTYEYLLEDVDANGTRTPHGPAVATVPYAIFLPLVAR
jgi:hypothetical protein